MSAKVIPIRPSKGVPRVVRGDYPAATDGVHVERSGKGYTIYRQHDGRRFELPISECELATIYHEAAVYVALDTATASGRTEHES